MRLRKVKDALKKLEAYKDYVYLNLEDFLKDKDKLFNNSNPVHLEVGCGKGQFVCNMAKAFPDINFIAMEKFDSVLLRSLERFQLETLPNVKFILADASSLTKYFEKEELDTIYLNFSDPWPKARNAKRRLTSPIFLNIYKEILKKDGFIIQKTDNKGLYSYSLESMSQNGFIFEKISVDLHSEDMFNVTTEFEDKWSKSGPIYYVKARIRND